MRLYQIMASGIPPPFSTGDCPPQSSIPQPPPFSTGDLPSPLCINFDDIVGLTPEKPRPEPFRINFDDIFGLDPTRREEIVYRAPAPLVPLPAQAAQTDHTPVYLPPPPPPRAAAVTVKPVSEPVVCVPTPKNAPRYTMPVVQAPVVSPPPVHVTRMGYAPPYAMQTGVYAQQVPYYSHRVQVVTL